MELRSLFKLLLKLSLKDGVCLPCLRAVIGLVKRVDRCDLVMENFIPPPWQSLVALARLLGDPVGALGLAVGLLAVDDVVQVLLPV